MRAVKSSKTRLEERRLIAASLLEEGLDTAQVARRLGVHRRSVQLWKRQYRLHGNQGLKAKPIPGRPPKLSEREKVLLRQKLHGSRLMAHAQIAKLIRDHFGKDYHVRHIGRLLASLGESR